MPSFDIISEVNMQELRNAVANAQREVSSRWDFREVSVSVELNEKKDEIQVSTVSEFQLQQLIDLLSNQLTKRNIASNAYELSTQVRHVGKSYTREITFKQGIEKEFAKKIVKLIQTHHPKTQVQIQDKQLRVSDKSKDILQKIKALVQQSDLQQPVQFTNFRD